MISLEATVRLTLPEFFILSEFHIEGRETLSAQVKEADHKKCARCWKQSPEVGGAFAWAQLHSASLEAAIAPLCLEDRSQAICLQVLLPQVILHT